jgi:hypothetical protein
LSSGKEVEELDDAFFKSLFEGNVSFEDLQGKRINGIQAYMQGSCSEREEDERLPCVTQYLITG